MLVADTYLGTLTDDDVAGRVDAADPFRVVLDDTDRRRSRVRTTTGDGTELGIIVGRELRDGDVLVARESESNTESGGERNDGEQLVVVELDGIPAVELSFEEVAPSGLPSAVVLGHAVGNRHRDLAVVDDRVLVRAEQDIDRLESLLAKHLPDGATTTRTTVSPAAFGAIADNSHTSNQSHTSSEYAHTSSGHPADGHTDHSHTHEGSVDNHQHSRSDVHGSRLEDTNT